MHLVNCGPGELSDRLTILSLKILFGEDAGKDVAHFKTEQAALLTQIRSRTLNGKWFEAYTELAAINAALWHAEDDLRLWREEAKGRIEDCDQALQEEIGGMAFRIQALNDQRHVRIEQINREAGELVGVEKVQ